MSISILVILLGSASALMDKEILLSPKKSGIQKFFFSWVKIGVIVAICIVTMKKEKDDAAEKAEAEVKQKARDSANATMYASRLERFSKENAYRLQDYSMKNADSLKQFSESNANKLENYSTNIVSLLGEYNLKYNAETNKIKAAIDTAKVKAEPFLTATMADHENSTRHIQSNDTLFLLPSISNLGSAPAMNIHFSIYYLFVSSDRRLHEFSQPIFVANNMDLPQRVDFTPLNIYIPHYYFDENNSEQYLLILGTYNGESGSSKNLRFAYAWDKKTKKWAFSTSSKELEILHDDKKNIIYF